MQVSTHNGTVERDGESFAIAGTRRTFVAVDLTPVGSDRTSVTLRHSGWRRDEIAGYGCGWQHYADCLVAHLAGTPLPSFDDDYPALLPYWREQAD